MPQAAEVRALRAQVRRQMQELKVLKNHCQLPAIGADSTLPQSDEPVAFY